MEFLYNIGFDGGILFVSDDSDAHKEAASFSLYEFLSAGTISVTVCFLSAIFN